VSKASSSIQIRVPRPLKIEISARVFFFKKIEFFLKMFLIFLDYVNIKNKILKIK
jgi:hypothetical protein